MPRARKLTPDPSRFPPCARCGAHLPAGATDWPEGRICCYCYDQARLRTGRCATCGRSGVVPGIDPAGQPLCIRCSGIPLDLTCGRCGDEGILARRGMCWRCVLTDHVNALLAGPDGVIPDHLRSLAGGLCSMRRPHSAVIWLRGSPQAEDVLRNLAHGELACTHAALDALPPSKAIEHLRGLLVTHGVLPPRDRRLATFLRWSAGKVDAIGDDGQRTIIERFLRWHLVRNLHRHAENGPIAEGPFLRSKQALTVGVEFLAWLGDRGRTLPECTQHDIDAWFAHGPSTREQADRLLYWAINRRILRGVDLPNLRQNRKTSPMISQHQRIAVLRRMLLDDELALQDRVAGCLVLLFGQIVSHIADLRLDDVQQDGDRTRIKLAKDWIDVPEPIANLLREHLADRKHMNTAANPDSPWLFPGCVPGEPRGFCHVYAILRRHGLPVLASRNATWQQLTREVPVHVIADALGISPRTAMRHAARAGADWAAYAARRLHS